MASGVLELAGGELGAGGFALPGPGGAVAALVVVPEFEPVSEEAVGAVGLEAGLDVGVEGFVGLWRVLA